MKEILYSLLVVLLTPIYLMIRVGSKLIELSYDIGQPIAEIIDKFIDNMKEFWKKIFKRKGDSENE